MAHAIVKVHASKYRMVEVDAPSQHCAMAIAAADVPKEKVPYILDASACGPDAWSVVLLVLDPNEMLDLLKLTNQGEVELVEGEDAETVFSRKEHIVINPELLQTPSPPKPRVELGVFALSSIRLVAAFGAFVALVVYALHLSCDALFLPATPSI